MHGEKLISNDRINKERSGVVWYFFLKSFNFPKLPGIFNFSLTFDKESPKSTLSVRQSAMQLY